MRYEFIIEGTASRAVRGSVPELDEVIPQHGTTALRGDVVDDAHLHGLLGRFEALGVSVVAMRRLPATSTRAEDPG